MVVIFVSFSSCYCNNSLGRRNAYSDVCLYYQTYYIRWVFHGDIILTQLVENRLNRECQFSSSVTLARLLSFHHNGNICQGNENKISSLRRFCLLQLKLCIYGECQEILTYCWSKHFKNILCFFCSSNFTVWYSWKRKCQAIF